MGLFDDDFYSPKVSSWEKRRWNNDGGDRWPGRIGKRWRGIGVVAAAAVGAVLLVMLSVQLWGAVMDDVAGGSSQNNLLSGQADGQPVSVVDIVANTKPAIVSVINSRNFVFDGAEESKQQVGVGSGIVYKKEGNKALVVTNHHVIDGAESLDVVLSDGKQLKAELVGSDALTDLAVLSIQAKDVRAVAEFGDSDALQEGEAAIAVGHPFGLGYSPTFTLGIISSLHRIIPISLAMDGTIDWEMELLQTDAAINHGNSGGALVNQEGKVIGINSMKVAQPGVEGLGFAIPSNAAAPIIAELEQYGKVRRPYLGVATVDLRNYEMDDEKHATLDLPEGVNEGLIVLEAYGPASEAGLRTNDVIVALDGKPVRDTLSLRKYLYGSKKIGDPIRVDFYRGGKQDAVTAKLSDTPDP